MYQLSRAMPSHLDMDTLLQTIADTALEQCEADEMSLMLPAHEGTKLAIAVVRGDTRTDLVGRCVPIEQGIAGWVARHREPVILYGAVQDPRFTPVRHRPDIHSAISVPLQAEGRLVGVLNLSATHRRPFGLQHVQASILLANTASSALGAASLYEQTRRAEAQYRSLFEQALVGLYQISPDGHLIRVNPILAQLLGYDTPEELMAAVAGIEAHLFVEPAHRADLARRLEASDVVWGCALQLYGRDGRVIWVSLSMNAIRDADGALLCYQGTVEEIAQRPQG
jgi:PAS domain S-box-containing protein